VLWSSLYYAALCPFANLLDGESFGFAQPSVRKAAWALVGALLKSSKGPSVSKITTLPLMKNIVRIETISRVNRPCVECGDLAVGMGGE
jgi:hypothetical protein